MTIYKGFRLDTFQEEAIAGIERNHTVLVSAPTGSGKTLVAEYLIDKFLKRGQRIFYTAPIKALNNQKFRQFRKRYGDQVGIMTGDVVINPDAPALMMTTEIYRNILFDDPQRVYDVGYIILDEVHYLDDVERGTVWEESIIFSPDNIRFLALSATVPNTRELADWIGSIKKHEVEVVQSKHRPVPLKHLLFTTGNKLVAPKDLKTAVKPPSSKAAAAKKRRRRRRPNQPDMNALVEILQNKQYLPGLFFVFSRRRTEEMATRIGREFDFTTGEEKQTINEIIEETVRGLGITRMPRVKGLLELLPRGIGFHNAGMLPVLKILVEDLFEQRLLNVLFATETFAVGVNMPARTVVFESLKKYDGRSLRTIHSREYFQMAGRAGRRGIDTFGHAISLFRPDDCTPGEIRDVLNEARGEALRSQFDLSYNSVLNLAALGAQEKIEAVLKNNFFQYQLDRQAKQWKRRLKKIQRRARERFKCWSGKADFEEFLSFQANLQRFPDPHRQRPPRKKGRRRRGRRRSEKYNKRSPLAGYACFQCQRKNRCARRIKWLVTEILSLREALDAYSDRHHVKEFWKKVAFLQKIGYLDELEPTDRGRFASHIHGYEIPVTELALNGLLEQLSEPETVACLACVVHEPRGEERMLKMPRSGNLRDRLAAAFSTVRHLRRKEKKHGLSAINPMQPSVAKMTFDWATGSTLTGAVRGCGFPEGDFVRLLRLVVDLLRQIKAASHGYNRLRDKLNRCMQRINRELVRPDLELGL